ncbi:E3 SUMO-protein ligase ZBED1-like [Prorops nasuta]|uniref:E3 SUMO-protein ligase ZBED1-like n=1 Tax=Prorops nasuta TaxID=863751 RepID=UPI0034CF9163
MIQKRFFMFCCLISIVPPQKSVTWKYFVKVAGGAKCNMCHSTITTSGNTTNMLKHLQRKHPNLENVEPASKKLRTETCVEVDPAEDDPIMPTKQKSVSLQNKHLKQQPTILQSLSSMKSYEVGGQKSNEITNAIMFMIAKDNCPLNIVEREGFKKLMKVIAPMYQIPSRKNITKLIEEKYNLLSSIISDRLSQVECISLTTDIWTDTLNTKSFLGITAHYIDSEKLKSATLSVVELSDRHTSNNIGDWILEVLELWRIKIENIVAIVSDNASNMTKAIKCTFGEHRFLSCFAHSLNLVAVQIISDVKIKNIIDKVKTIVKYFKHSVVASDELRKKSELKLIQSVPTRWNSTFYMLQRFTEQSLIVGSVLLSLPDSPLMLSASEILTVKEFVIVLRPFERTTIELCTERHTSIGKVIPIINCLRKNLIGLNLETDNAKQLRDLSITALEERFKNIENNTMLAVATILDPRFKCLHFKHNVSLSKAISFIKNELYNNIQFESSLDNRIVNIQESLEDSNDLWCHHKQLIAIENKSNNEHSSNSEDLPKSLQHYLNIATSSLESDPITFWIKDFGGSYTNLRNLALKYLPITATSVPAERLFSKAGNILTESRNRLSSKHLHQLLFLNSLSEELFY